MDGAGAQMSSQDAQVLEAETQLEAELEAQLELQDEIPPEQPDLQEDAEPLAEDSQAELVQAPLQQEASTEQTAGFEGAAEKPLQQNPGSEAGESAREVLEQDQNPKSQDGATATEALEQEQNPKSQGGVTATEALEQEQNPKSQGGDAAKEGSEQDQNPESQRGVTANEGSEQHQNPEPQSGDTSRAASDAAESAEPRKTVPMTTGQGAVYTALATGIIDDIVYNRSSSFEIKEDVLRKKEHETEDDRLHRIAHVLYMRMNRSFKSCLAASVL